ncbi:hypothetical protein D3C72_2221430 [compost metagenome]
MTMQIAATFPGGLHIAKVRFAAAKHPHVCAHMLVDIVIDQGDQSVTNWKFLHSYDLQIEKPP